MSNTLFPIFLILEHLKVLVIGGGFVADEKLTALVNNCPNANITVVAQEWRNAKIEMLSKKYTNIKLISDSYHDKYLDSMDLVICATDDFKLHKRVKIECESRHLLCNVADTPKLCDFYLSSVVQKGDLKIAISSNGKSPTLTKRLRVFFEELIDSNDINDILDNLADIRNNINASFKHKVKILNEATKSFVVKKDEK